MKIKNKLLLSAYTALHVLSDPSHGMMHDKEDTVTDSVSRPTLQGLNGSVPIDTENTTMGRASQQHAKARAALHLPASEHGHKVDLEGDLDFSALLWGLRTLRGQLHELTDPSAIETIHRTMGVINQQISKMVGMDSTFLSQKQKGDMSRPPTWQEEEHDGRTDQHIVNFHAVYHHAGRLLSNQTDYDMNGMLLKTQTERDEAGMKLMLQAARNEHPIACRAISSLILDGKLNTELDFSHSGSTLKMLPGKEKDRFYNASKFLCMSIVFHRIAILNHLMGAQSKRDLGMCYHNLGALMQQRNTSVFFEFKEKDKQIVFQERQLQSTEHPSAAADYYRRAIQEGFEESANYLGRLIELDQVHADENNQPIDRTNKMAVVRRLYLQSNTAAGFRNLGMTYIKSDPHQAITHFKEAMKRGDIYAAHYYHELLTEYPKLLQPIPPQTPAHVQEPLPAAPASARSAYTSSSVSSGTATSAAVLALLPSTNPAAAGTSSASSAVPSTTAASTTTSTTTPSTGFVSTSAGTVALRAVPTPLPAATPVNIKRGDSSDEEKDSDDEKQDRAPTSQVLDHGSLEKKKSQEKNNN